MQDSADEHRQVEQSTRVSKSGTFAGLAMARLASRVTMGMKKFILNEGGIFSEVLIQSICRFLRWVSNQKLEVPDVGLFIERGRLGDLPIIYKAVEMIRSYVK